MAFSCLKLYHTLEWALNVAVIDSESGFREHLDVPIINRSFSGIF